MKFTTLTAKFPGKCRRCGESFAAGTKIRYGGRGLTYHFAAECAGKPAGESGASAIVASAVAARNGNGRPSGYTYNGPNDYTPVYGPAVGAGASLDAAGF